MNMLRDFRFAFRTLASRPAFTLVAALSLGLGIGANSAIFSLVDSLWFRPMAVPKAGEIVRGFSLPDQDAGDRCRTPSIWISSGRRHRSVNSRPWAGGD